MSVVPMFLNSGADVAVESLGVLWNMFFADSTNMSTPDHSSSPSNSSSKLFSTSTDIWMNICFFLEGRDVFRITHGMNRDLRHSFIESEPKTNENFWRDLYERDFIVQRASKNGSTTDEPRGDLPQPLLSDSTLIVRVTYFERVKSHRENFVAPSVLPILSVDSTDAIDRLVSKLTTDYQNTSDMTDSTRTFAPGTVSLQAYALYAESQLELWRHRASMSIAHQDNCCELNALLTAVPTSYATDIFRWIGSGGVAYENIDFKEDEGTATVTVCLYPLHKIAPRVRIDGEYEINEGMTHAPDHIEFSLGTRPLFTNQDNTFAQLLFHLFGYDTRQMEENVLRQLCALLGCILNGGTMFKRTIRNTLETAAGLKRSHMVM